jgi:hypothetical protein
MTNHIENSNTQSGGTEVRTSFMASDMLRVELDYSDGETYEMVTVAIYLRYG